MSESEFAKQDSADESKPRRRWFSYSRPWGLLAKCNPNATPGSVARQAIVCGIAAPLFQGFVLWLINAPAIHFQLRIPAFAVLGALVGAVMEWQVDDNEEDLSDDSGDQRLPPV